VRVLAQKPAGNAARFRFGTRVGGCRNGDAIRPDGPGEGVRATADPGRRTLVAFRGEVRATPMDAIWRIGPMDDRCSAIFNSR
jgi:hypothetical protein